MNIYQTSTQYYQGVRNPDFKPKHMFSQVVIGQPLKQEILPFKTLEYDNSGRNNIFPQIKSRNIKKMRPAKSHINSKFVDTFGNAPITSIEDSSNNKNDRSFSKDRSGMGVRSQFEPSDENPLKVRQEFTKSNYKTIDNSDIKDLTSFHVSIVS